MSICNRLASISDHIHCEPSDVTSRQAMLATNHLYRPELSAITIAYLAPHAHPCCHLVSTVHHIAPNSQLYPYLVERSILSSSDRTRGSGSFLYVPSRASMNECSRCDLLSQPAISELHCLAINLPYKSCWPAARVQQTQAHSRRRRQSTCVCPFVAPAQSS